MMMSACMILDFQIKIYIIFKSYDFYDFFKIWKSWGATGIIDVVYMPHSQLKPVADIVPSMLLCYSMD